MFQTAAKQYALTKTFCLVQIKEAVREHSSPIHMMNSLQEEHFWDETSMNLIPLKMVQ